MKEYIAKPIVVVTVQWNGDNKEEIMEFFGVPPRQLKRVGSIVVGETSGGFVLKTYFDNVLKGQWLLRMPSGTVLCFNDETFQERFQIV